MKPKNTLQKNTSATPHDLSPVAKLLCFTGGFLLLLLLCVSYFNGMWMKDALCLYIAVLCGGISIIYSLRDITNRFVLLCFNANSLLFLVGGMLSTQLRGDYLPGYLGTGPLAATHTCHMLAISLLIVNLTFVLAYHPQADPLAKRPWQKKKETATTRPLAPATQTVIFLMVVVTMLGKLAGAFIQLRFTAASSYIDSYTTSFNKPIYVWLPESIFYFSLCLWMATNPKKKLLFVMMIPFFLIEGVILLSGDRGEPMCALLMVLYYLYRRSKREEGFLNLKKRHAVIALVLVPVLVVGLQTVKYTRVHQEVSIGPELLMEFIEDQGVSAGVIAKAYTSKEAITQIGGSSYVAGSLRIYIRNNLLTRLITGKEPIGNNTIATATSGDSLGSSVAYLWLRNGYLAGKGCGSSYIAEFFHDGGLFYMMLGSVFVALLLVVMMRELKRDDQHPFRAAFALLAFKDLIVISRTSTFTWITNTFTVQNLLVLVVLILFNQLMLEDRKGGRHRENRHLNHPRVG